MFEEIHDVALLDGVLASKQRETLYGGWRTDVEIELVGTLLCDVQAHIEV